MKYIFPILFIFMAVNPCMSQIDSSYISPFKYRMAIRPYTNRDILLLSKEVKSEPDVSYMPNTPPNIGIGFSVNNTIINFGYGYGFDFLRDKKYGKTRSLDFQLHNYGRKYVFDIFVQNYKGFYIEDEKSQDITLCPDLKVKKYGLYGQYIFNNKRYSYKAAFDQNEKQIKSTGSFLLGAGIYLTEITSDSSFVFRGKNYLNNFQFGVSAGYAYTWVLGRYWDISASTTVGMNIGSEKINTFGKQKLEIYPTVFPRVSAGYNRESWSLGFSFVGNGVFPSMSDNANVSAYSLRMQLSFVKRFSLIPIIDKKKITQ